MTDYASFNNTGNDDQLAERLLDLKIEQQTMTNQQIPCLNDGFVQLIDHMGSDASICNAARVSYGNHETRDQIINRIRGQEIRESGNGDLPDEICIDLHNAQQVDKDRNLIRYLMRHRHTTPFEMVEFIFLVRAPIHVARQWFRHRTWSYNEYSTRYKEAIDSFETTEPDKWRTQAKNNKQGSEGYIPICLPIDFQNSHARDGQDLCEKEELLHLKLKDIYEERLNAGVAREQARKDLPLSTYTEFYAKIDLHNLFHFLSLRMDGHAQLEIRTYANAISNIIKPLVPMAYEAFEDYRLNGCFFSAQEMLYLRRLLDSQDTEHDEKPESFSDREWKEFKEKLSVSNF